MSAKDIATTSSRESYEDSNDFATVRIPPEKRRSVVSVSLVLVGFSISMAGMYTGAELTRGLTASQALMAALFGNAILVIYAGLAGIIGTREGLSTAMLLRFPFGRDGSKFISSIFAITLVGWYSWQCGFFGNTINAMFPGGGFITNAQFAAVWGGFMMMISAYRGMKGLVVLSWIAVPALIIAAAAGMILSITQGGGIDAIAAIPVDGPVDFQTAVVMVVGAFAVGGVIQADCTRYSKGPGVSMIATILGLLFAHTFVIMAGYMMCLIVGTTDIAFAMLRLLSMWALFVLIIGQWTTNDNNLYSSSLALSNIIKVPKKKIVLVLGTVASISAAAGLADLFASWLMLLGVSIPPVAGILVADYFFVCKGKYGFGEGTRYGGISITAFSSWIIATIVGFTFTWGIQSINAVVSAFIVYLIIENLFRKTGWKKFIGKAHIELADGNTVITD